MPVYQINPARTRRLSRVLAFEAQGVALKYPLHSWSGLRPDDGVIVVGIRATDVQVDDCGCSCLLWSPATDPSEGMDRASHLERFEHCSLAVCHGAAEALLAYGEDEAFKAGEVIALRVVRIGNQYWAKWGSVARAEYSNRFTLPGICRAEACLAA
jgi:hypothetical protein